MSWNPMVDPQVFESAGHCEQKSEQEIEQIRQFEQEAAQYLGADYAEFCSGEHDSLAMVLAVAGISSGDEIITTPFASIVTTEAILEAGATPVFVDIEPETFNLNPQYLNAALSEKTKAILVVHQFGLPARILEIQEFCQTYNLTLIEDSSQSLGAEIAGIKTGCFGDFGCFRFCSGENELRGSGAGLVITNSDKNRVKLQQSRTPDTTNSCQNKVGNDNNYMDERKASQYRFLLKYLDENNRRRLNVAHYYNEALSGQELLLPFGDGHIFSQYMIQVDDCDYLKNRLNSAGIVQDVHYPAALHHPAFRNRKYRTVGELFAAETASKHCLSLPIYSGMPEADCRRVVSVIKEVLGQTLMVEV
ncbi:hypothetical protein EOPP23_08870 [Endozoicomonas sp. OPT23]|uniref:DegT/DnrJ/EryC1/StrS family aminotransferase n=1 Tax=Endozoicomonas sp. OPT23 TaxID=2072845 RepID=UPI00129A6C98|nr:DegT/DnrJ/EryC1/StrS family aminotransferase [Endozoicomonas sp. OPT23]MRI33094.1 hypothetical protein [Endozoicomonas sp. OPT23]